MNQDQYRQLTRWINAHLDGLMDASQQQTFERARAQSAALRAELDCQTRIDETLRRVFTPPPVDAVLARIMGLPQAVAAAPAPSRGRARISPWVRHTAIAAAVVLLAVGGWWGWWIRQDDQGLTTPQIAMPMPKLRMEQAYRDIVATGFKPTWVCQDEREFATTFYLKLGQGLVFNHAPAGVAMVGLSYVNCLTTATTVFLADVHGEQVLVFVDKLANDAKPKLSGDCRLHLFRRQIDTLVLYEVSPLDKPSVLDYFQEKEIPDEWIKQATYHP